MKKFLCTLLVAIIALCSFAVAEEVAPAIVDAKVITYVTDEARSVAGIRIEYDQDIVTDTYHVEDYFVTGYDNIACYVSETGEMKEASYAGKYVIVEFQLSQVPGYYDGKIDFWTTDNTFIDMTLDIFCPKDNCWVTTTGDIHYEADDFISGSVTNDSGIETLYRLFVPEGYEEKSDSLEALPLVIWLHGSGESGTDNEEQLVGNRGALNFASKEAQADHPAFVLAPQTNDGWYKDEAVAENVRAIVVELMGKYNVDGARIYVTGCSMGGIGTRYLTQKYPEMVAAAVPIATNGYDDVITRGVGEDDRTKYEGIPMLYIVSANDPNFYSKDETLSDEERAVEAQVQKNIDAFEALGMTTYASIGEDALNGFLRGKLAALEMQEVLDAAAEAGADKIFVTYLAGTVYPSPHSSWMAATANTAVRDWMFSQAKEAPFAG